MQFCDITSDGTPRVTCRVNGFYPPPAVLQVCQESRKVGLKVFVLTTFDNPEHLPKIYIDKLNDRVHTKFSFNRYTYTLGSS
jgi:hypothetical protein